MTYPWGQSACPEEAERDYEAFCQAYRESEGADWPTSTQAQILLRIFGNALFLSQHLIRYPAVARHFLGLAQWHEEKSRAQHKSDLAALVGSHTTLTDALTALKRYKYAEYVRLTLRELTFQNQAATYREFASLARTVTETLTRILQRELAARYDSPEDGVGNFAIIAMGKLGGDELNYSSDIDLIGLYDKEGDVAHITRHEFFSKLFSEAGNLLSAYDENGFLYRVDWDLRPEGQTGTLANSLDAMETYYETFGAEWERQAFIKADVLCESGSLGAQFLDMMSPFVYRKYLDSGTIERIRDMKSRVISELDKKRIDGINIKLGHGGIRDVEFLVQGLQLLHAGKLPALRHKGTLPALDALVHAGLIETQQAGLLHDGYLFLRRVESAIQMENERQTHVLKSSGKDRLKIARRLGFTGEAQTSLDEFNEALEKAMGFIHQAFQTFYG